MPHFTPEQLDAIESRGENLLVSAAAGSGKTAVLVERIVSLLKEGATLERMLVVTYTRAAAAEMRSRVAERLALEEGLPGLRRQRSLLPRAQIGTLHGFCADLLRRHFLEADLTPSFVVDAGPGRFEMERRAMRETLDEALSEGNTAALLARLGKTYQYEEMLRRTGEFLLCQVDPDAWAEEAVAQYGAMVADFNASPLGRSRALRREELLEEALLCVRRAQDLARLPDGPAHYLAALLGDEEALLASMEGSEALFARMPNKKKPDTPLQDEAKALRDRARGLFAEAQALAAPDERDILRMHDMQPSLAALLSVTQAYNRRYEELRVAAGKLSYSDLEHRTLRALKNPSVAEALRERYDYILVDEYQDANAVQEAILSSIARADNRFLVGDVKQSIYRFRMADPTVFLEKQRRYGRLEGGRRIDLNLNFRSVPSVLHAVNHVFARAMNGGLSEIEYDERAALVAGREGVEGLPVDVALLMRPKEEDEGEDDRDDPVAELQDAEFEAAEVARHIASMIGKPLTPGGEPVRARDVAILMRAVRPSASAFRSALEARGIQVALDTGGALFTTLEARNFLDLLRAIDNRRRDVPLLGAMRAFGGFALEELARIRLIEPKGDFAEAAFACAQGTNALGKKAADFLARLLAWRREARIVPLSDFLMSVMEKTRFERSAALSPGGAVRVQNLRALVAMAARMPGASLGDYLDAVSQMEATGSDESAAREFAEDMDAVRVMTVHKSKGLEFPVVFGSGLGRTINRMDARRALLMHRELGIASQWVDDAVAKKAKTPAQEALAQAIDREGLAEEARVLYVMMTRAREKLVLTGVLKSPDAALLRWATAGEGIAGVRTLMDILGPALLRHEDGATLRTLMYSPPDALPHPARYDVRIVKGVELIDAPVRRDAPLELFRRQEARAGQDVPRELAARLGFRPARVEPGAPQKTSVTAASRRRTGVARPPALPLFLEGTRVNPAAQRGLAMHAVLRALDFASLRSLEGEALGGAVAKQVEAMEQNLLLTRTQARDIRANSIVDFLRGELGRAALASSEVMREQPFNLRVDDGEAVRLMQGIIDLCFVDGEGSWVLIDYKTDRVGLKPEEVRERHGAQLESYARALAELTGRPVSRRLVYLFHNGTIVEV